MAEAPVKTAADDRQPLEFESDPGASRSRWVAGGLALVVLGWMGSGYIFPSASDQEIATGPLKIKPVSVAVRSSTAETVEQIFVAEGQALPDRDTIVRAETSGRIEEVLVGKGADLAAGQVIARFDVAGRQAELVRAEQELSRAQREFDNAEALLQRGISTADRLADARAMLAAAQAGAKAAQETVGDTEIRAPFAGRLEALDVEAGEFVSLGGEVGRVVDNSPLTIGIQIPQQSIRDIEVGQMAEVSFITGASAQGVVRFVSTSADPETRTFAGEIEVPNMDRSIPAGISARLRLRTGEARAHFVSPAILSLDTDGTLGVKTVDAANKVVFHKVGIIRAQTDGIWISGLPEKARIISIGQGFVNDGETVDPQEENAAARLLHQPASVVGVTDMAAVPQAQAETSGQDLTIEQGTGAAPAVDAGAGPEATR